jgi:Domain of unknown function (DUF5615)
LRVLFDAHVSNRRVGESLRRAGHDVLALDQDEALGSLADEEVLALAVEEERIVITHNVRNFVPIVRSWMETRRTHRAWFSSRSRITTTARSSAGSSEHSPRALTRTSGSIAPSSLGVADPL